MDKLVEVRLRDARRVLLLIHLEVQARLDAAFVPRMYVYHYRLLDKHPGYEVIHLVILTRSAGGEPVLIHRLAPLGGRFGHVEFVFPVIHLAEWAQRRGELLGMAGSNPFTLPPALEHEFTAVLDEIEGEYEVAYITSVERVWTRRGLAQGLEQGRMEGLRQILLAQLERRYGPVPADARERIDAAPVDTLQGWLLRLLDAPTLDDALR